MAQRKLRILVDMDGTIAKFNWKISERWSELFSALPPIAAEDLDNWRTDECYAKVHGDWAAKAVRDIYQGKDFFNTLEVIPGAVDALQEMIAAGHDVFFCTSPVGVYTFCVHDKYAWVEKHFGKEWMKRIILTGDKTFISADC